MNLLSSEFEPTGWDVSLWSLLVVLCGVQFLDALDSSMVGVALPTIQRALHLTTSQLQWIVSAYVLGYGGLLLLGGRVADLFGRRLVLLLALVVFLLASLAGTLVDNGTLLIITRFLKGAAAAFTAPAALSIITTTFAEGAGRNRALGIFAACSASGFTMGLILGGLLTEIGWRWTFVLPVPIALVLLLSASRLIPHEAPGDLDGRRRLDLWGAVTVTAGMLLLVDTVVRAPEIGWTAGGTLIGFAITALLLAGFVGIEQRVAHPLVRLGILRNLSLVRANLGAAGVFGSYFGFQFIGTLYLQSTLGWSPLQTGLGFLPSGLIVAFGAPRVWVLVNRYGTQRIFGLGALGFLSAYLLFLRIDAAPVYVAVIMPSMVLIGIAFALCFPSLNLQATNGVADQEQGLASGLLNTSFQLGGAIGLAITSAVISSGLAHGDSALDAYKPAIVVVAGIAALAFLAALSGLLPNRRAAAPQPSD